MTAYAPGQTYRLPLTFVETGPDATPTVVVRRNFSVVSPTVTVSGSGSQWGVSFTIPSDWVDGDTVQVIVSWERGGEAEQIDDVFQVVATTTIQLLSGPPRVPADVMIGGWRVRIHIQ